jgi:hypothetical protein
MNHPVALARAQHRLDGVITEQTAPAGTAQRSRWIGEAVDALRDGTASQLAARDIAHVDLSRRDDARGRRLTSRR